MTAGCGQGLPWLLRWDCRMRQCYLLMIIMLVLFPVCTLVVRVRLPVAVSGCHGRYDEIVGAAVLVTNDY